MYLLIWDQYYSVPDEFSYIIRLPLSTSRDTSSNRLIDQANLDQEIVLYDSFE